MRDCPRYLLEFGAIDGLEFSHLTVLDPPMIAVQTCGVSQAIGFRWVAGWVAGQGGRGVTSAAASPLASILAARRQKSHTT